MNSVNSDGLKTFSHGKGQNWYHVIIVPRARCSVFKYETTKSLCEQGLRDTCKRNRIELFTYEVMPDHVHLFVSCPPRKSILDACSIIKGGTSHYVRKHMQSLKRYPRLWSRGIFYRSVGNVNARVVRKYIDESSNNNLKRTTEMQQQLF